MRASTEGTRARYGCPEWCERWDHDIDPDDLPNAERAHYGPVFGGHVQVRSVGDRLVIDLADSGLLDGSPLAVAAKVALLRAELCAALRWIDAEALP